MTQIIIPKETGLSVKGIKVLSGEKHFFLDEGQRCGGEGHILLVEKSSWLSLSTRSMNSLRPLFIPLFIFIERNFFMCVCFVL